MKNRTYSTKRLGIQLIAVILAGLISLATYFIVTDYFKTIQKAEDDTMQVLETVAKTIALNLDGNQHEYLVNEFLKKDGIRKTSDHPIYQYLHNYMRRVQIANNIETDIYTLFKDTAGPNSETNFYFGVTSGLTPYYRHPYLNYPKKLEEFYEVGARIPVFKDDHGTWLSYFTPLKNSKGKVVAVVQVDCKFDIFIENSRLEALRSVGISLVIFILIGAVLLLTVRNIIKIDELKSQRLISMHEQVKSQHKDITDSINYSERIQKAIVPNIDKIEDSFSEAMLLYKAKDVISGDFPWILEQEDGTTYIAAVDCTGHGVPGCMLSFVGYFLLNDIVGNNNKIMPNEVLRRLNNGVVKTLQQEHDHTSNDGMDIALCCIDSKRKTLYFSGAHRPLYILRNNEIEIIKGDRQAIGGLSHTQDNKEFTNHVVNIQRGDKIFFFSDGLQDQFGGDDDKERKYSTKRIREILVKNYNLPMDKLKKVIERDFNEWMGNSYQIDDVLLIGLSF